MDYLRAALDLFIAHPIGYIYAALMVMCAGWVGYALAVITGFTALFDDN